MDRDYFLELACLFRIFASIIWIYKIARTDKGIQIKTFSILLKINSINLKLFYYEIFDKFDWVLHLKISQSHNDYSITDSYWIHL